MDLMSLAIGAVVGFVVGVFVYRNNVDLFAPFASKIDTKFDELADKLKVLEAKLEAATKK